MRDGTAAARLPGHVPTPVKKARSRQLHRIAAAMKQAHVARFVGQTRDVLFEGDGHTGYTDNYLRVRVDRSLPNCVAATRLVATDGDSLVGEVVEASPVERTSVRRLPVVA